MHGEGAHLLLVARQRAQLHVRVRVPYAHRLVLRAAEEQSAAAGDGESTHEAVVAGELGLALEAVLLQPPHAHGLVLRRGEELPLGGHHEVDVTRVPGDDAAARVAARHVTAHWLRPRRMRLGRRVAAAALGAAAWRDLPPVRQPRGAHVVLLIEQPCEDVLVLLLSAAGPLGPLVGCGCGRGCGGRAGELHPHRPCLCTAAAAALAAGAAGRAAASSSSGLAAGGASRGGLAQAHGRVAVAPATQVH